MWSWGCSKSLPSPMSLMTRWKPTDGIVSWECSPLVSGRQAPCRVHFLCHTATWAALVPGAYTRGGYQGWTSPSSHPLPVLKIRGQEKKTRVPVTGVTGGPGSVQWTCDVCVKQHGWWSVLLRSPPFPTSLSGVSRITASLIHSIHSLGRGLPLRGGGWEPELFHLLSPPPSPAGFSKQAFIQILNKFTWMFLEGKQSCSISSCALNLLVSIFNCPICAIYFNGSWQSHGWNMFWVTASIKVTEYFMRLLGGEKKKGKSVWDQFSNSFNLFVLPAIFST